MALNILFFITTNQFESDRRILSEILLKNSKFLQKSTDEIIIKNEL